MPGLLLCAALAAGCSFQSYSAKPLDAAATADALRARDPLGSGFQAYLAQQGYAPLPPAAWGLRELTYSALYFHPDLDVARATWRAAQAAEIRAGERRNPGIATTTEHHSERLNGDSPWTFGLEIELPIETGGKRAARIDQAERLTEASRIEIAAAAWKVRSRLQASWIEYQASSAAIGLLEEELALRDEMVAMLEARLHAGMISSVELTSARLLQQQAKQALERERTRQAVLKVDLAHDAGLTADKLDQLPLARPQADERLSAESARRAFMQDTARQVRESALLNRLDIRAALVRYDAAEAGLRLEIARQYPDITLSPGYSYDQGDRIWSIGFSTLLALLNRNEAGIAAAEAQRELEASRFRALQAEILKELESRAAAYRRAILDLAQAEQLQRAQAERVRQSRRQFEQGQIDRLEYAGVRLESLTARQNAIRAEFDTRRAARALEASMQVPLENLTPPPQETARETRPSVISETRHEP